MRRLSSQFPPRAATAAATRSTNPGRSLPEIVRIKSFAMCRSCAPGRESQEEEIERSGFALPPRVHPLPQGGNVVRSRAGEIVRLLRISFQIIKLHGSRGFVQAGNDQFEILSD